MKPNVRETILKSCSLLADRIVFSAPRTLRVEDIDRGVVVIFAVWSGPSQVGWRELSGIFADHAMPQFPVYIVDTDELTAEFVDKLPLLPHGYSESFWIHGGQILHAWSLKTGPIDGIRQFTEEAFRQ